MSARLAVPVVALLLLALLTVLVIRGSGVVTAVDDAAAASAAALQASSPGLRTANGWLAGTGSSILLGAGALVIVALPAARRRVHEASWILAAVVVQYLAEVVLTPLVARRPPSGALEAGYVFPSGHTATATVVLVVLLAVVRTRRASWWLAVGSGVLVVAAIGASRVLASAHHATDVLGGILLGLLVAASVAPLVVGSAVPGGQAAYRRPRHRRPGAP